jgi:hypothetical protein
MDFFLRTRSDIPTELNRIGLVGVGVEVGVLRGEFSEELLASWNGKRLYLVDAWRQEEGRLDANNAGPQVQLQNYAETFQRVYRFGERAVIVRDLSIRAAELFGDESLDFVYIDAAHDEKSVLADLKSWTPKVRQGGFVIGDDYADGVWSYRPRDDAPEEFTSFGVKSAVDAFVAENGFELFLTNEAKPQWWFLKGE